MDAVKQEPRKLAPHQEDYIEVENHCCLCGTELVFQFEPSEEIHLIKERAHCPCCNVQLKEREHVIH
ncbi:MAG: hypothetical protein KDD33_09780 [Bdellovibrionales bacterium]|nr:hypothetical protein [Bdellovibrionales bacterium]